MKGVNSKERLLWLYLSYSAVGLFLVKSKFSEWQDLFYACSTYAMHVWFFPSRENCQASVNEKEAWNIPSFPLTSY